MGEKSRVGGGDTIVGKVGAVVVAAGESRRMAGRDKIFDQLLGRPFIWYSLNTLNSAPQIDAIVLVLPRENVERGWELVRDHGLRKVSDVCPGGERRQDSVRAGLDRLGDSEWIVVHDGARPFLDHGLIAAGLAEAKQTGGALAAVPVRDTIKSAGTDLIVTDTLQRDRLWAAQTPQVFRRDLLAEAHRRVTEYVTDDASMIERIGGKVRIFPGSPSNIKVTTPEDLPIAEAILRAQQSGRLVETE